MKYAIQIASGQLLDNDLKSESDETKARLFDTESDAQIILDSLQLQGRVVEMIFVEDEDLESWL